MTLDSILKDFGLSKRQAQLYLNCLELGSASAYKIAKKANIPRSTCYEELDDLREKGLISTFRKKQVKYYNAEDPQKFIRNRKDKIKVFEEMMPEFNAIFMKYKNQPHVRFYEGVSNIETIFTEMLDDHPREIAYFGSTDVLSVMGKYWENFQTRRIKKKIMTKGILFNTPLARERQRLGVKQLRENRIISSKYEHHGTMAIWKNKIALFSFKRELMALVVESPELAQMQHMMWQVIWDNLEDNKKQTTRLV